MKSNLRYYLKNKKKDLNQIKLWTLLVSFTIGTGLIWWLITQVVFKHWAD